MKRTYNTDKKRRETPDGESKTPIFRNEADGRVYRKGGSVMLLEVVVLGVAMMIYIGAEWIAEDVVK
jgi:hypothetical protein